MPRNKPTEMALEALNKAHKEILDSKSNPTGVFVIVAFEDGDIARTAVLSEFLNHITLIGALDAMKHSMLMDLHRAERMEHLGTVRREASSP